jgi:hypothetical protein
MDHFPQTWLPVIGKHLRKHLGLPAIRLRRDNLGENGAAIRIRSGGRGASCSRRTRTDASAL